MYKHIALYIFIYVSVNEYYFIYTKAEKFNKNIKYSYLVQRIFLSEVGYLRMLQIL